MAHIDRLPFDGSAATRAAQTYFGFQFSKLLLGRYGYFNPPNHAEAKKDITEYIVGFYNC